MAATTEDIIWEGSQSQVLNFGVFAAMFVIIIGVTIVSILFFPLLIVLNIVPLIYIFYHWLLVKSHKYKITTQRIFNTTGIFSKKTDALELYRVKDLDVIEPFTLRIFKLGNIEIVSADESSSKFYLRAIPKPKELMDKIRTHVELRRDLKRIRGVDFLDDHPDGDIS
jgi:uncharacterized membrane protein YdbT with pleckstrin-like domain